MAFAFLLLIALQGLAAWRALDWAGAAESRGARQELARIAQFSQAVVSADSVAALQVNLAAIQAPPLGSVDQSQSLAAIKSGLLAQLQAVEQRAKATSGGQVGDGSESVPGKALDPAKLLALGKDCLRVVLLSLGFALAFAAAAQRKGSALSVLAEWRQAMEVRLEVGRSRRSKSWPGRRRSGGAMSLGSCRSLWNASTTWWPPGRSPQRRRGSPPALDGAKIAPAAGGGCVLFRGPRGLFRGPRGRGQASAGLTGSCCWRPGSAITARSIQSRSPSN